MAENSGRARSEKMARAVSIAALRDLAARRLPHALFDFIDGGATDEITMRHNETDFGKWMLVPRYAADVSRRNLSTDMLGRMADMPLMLSPTGLAGMFWPHGELHACARQPRPTFHCASRQTLSARWKRWPKLRRTPIAGSSFIS